MGEEEEEEKEKEKSERTQYSGPESLEFLASRAPTYWKMLGSLCLVACE